MLFQLKTLLVKRLYGARLAKAELWTALLIVCERNLGCPISSKELQPLHSVEDAKGKTALGIPCAGERHSACSLALVLIFRKVSAGLC